MSNSARSAFLKRAGVRRRASKLYGHEETHINSLSPGRRLQLDDFDPTEWGWSQDEVEAMTGDQLAALKAATVQARICVMACVDKSGKPLLKPEDVKQIQADGDDVTYNALADEILDHSGMGEDNADKLLGKPDNDSDKTPTV